MIAALCIAGFIGTVLLGFKFLVLCEQVSEIWDVVVRPVREKEEKEKE